MKKKFNLNELKRLADFASPMSWIYLSAFANIPLIYILFQPTAKELMILLLVDILPVPLHAWLCAHLFVKLFPKAKFYFHDVKEDAIQALPLPEKINLFEAMVATPHRSAIWGVLYSLFKIIPGVLVVVFVWKHKMSNWEQFFSIMGVGLINASHFYGVVAIEGHRKLSEIVRDLHERYDWTEVFRGSFLPYSRRYFALQERVPSILVFAFTLLTQCGVILNHPLEASQLSLMVKVVIVTLVGLMLHARNRYLVRALFVEGLENIFENMQSMKIKRPNFSLSLHTFPLLGRFEQSFNDLLQRVRVGEQELSSLVIHKSEESRYQALGEFTALVAHDLSNPLHTIQFLVDELSKDPEKFVTDKKSLRHLKANVDSSISFVSSIRNRLRSSDSGEPFSRVYDAYANVLQLLERTLHHQFVSVEFCDSIKNEAAKLAPMDLIHIFHNLFSNSLKNFSDHEVRERRISITGKLDSEANRLVIFFSDSGTGLSQEKFEEATAFRFMSDQRGGTGLGLRLIRRLLEQKDCSLTLVPPVHGKFGTTFAINLERATLPVAPPKPRSLASAQYARL